MRTRLRIRVAGIVQGVGFRPCVYALVTRLRIGGCVSNDSQGVLIEAEGSGAERLRLAGHGHVCRLPA
jgi:hydrogenase maturation protein HypF